jgi:hypothetical protein
MANVKRVITSQKDAIKVFTVLTAIFLIVALVCLAPKTEASKLVHIIFASYGAACLLLACTAAIRLGSAKKALAEDSKRGAAKPVQVKKSEPVVKKVAEQRVAAAKLPDENKEVITQKKTPKQTKPAPKTLADLKKTTQSKQQQQRKPNQSNRKQSKRKISKTVKHKKARK